MDRSTRCYVLWRCGGESPVDYAQLRGLLEPLVTALKDAGTHAILPSLCEELGLSVPAAGGSRRDRMNVTFTDRC